MRKFRRWMFGLVAALTLVSASGCSVASQPRELDPNVDAAFAKFYTQPIDWNRCDKFDCADVMVPMNWNDPEGEVITISVIRSKATGANPIGDLLLNPGGPGSSGVNFVRDNLEYIGTEALRENYNLIGFDPRGTGDSSPVTCLDDAGLDEFLYSQSPYPNDEAKDLEYWAGLTAKFGEACIKNTGEVIKYLDTQSAAKDMDVIRSYLGQDKLDYVGFSYGTLLGATYASIFPERVDRFVLDGAIDPRVSDEQQSLNQLGGFELAIGNYASWCLEQPNCPFSGNKANVLKQIRAWFENLETNPLPTQDGRELTISAGITGVILAMYSDDYWPILTDAFNEVKTGDATTLMRMADFYNDRGEDGRYSTNTLEANIVISCLDGQQSTKPSDIAAQNARAKKIGTVFGDYWQNGYMSCTWVDFGPVEPLASFAAEGAPSILVVGTTGDPATPYEQAVALAHDVLANGFLLTYEGEGHTAYGRSNACVDQTVDDFLLEGKLPESEPTC